MAQVFGKRWEVIQALSEGGQAHTFLVKDLGDPDAPPSALKRLKNPKRLDRFIAEVKAIQKIGHKNVLTVQDYDLDHDPTYFVTEFCKGGPLSEWCEKAWPSLQQSLELFVTIADAVNHAHSQGVIHRDIKPDNIFVRLPGDEPVVGDFGLCFLSDTKDRNTATGEAVGSRWFMAPEMESGRAEEVTPAADVYSLGKLLYWLASGGKMFSREELREKGYNLSDIVQHPFQKGVNPEAEHVSRLLETMIVHGAGKRAALSDVILAAKQTAQIVALHQNPIGGSFRQTCTFCGWGFYKTIATGNGAAVGNFGLGNVGTADWRILACSECGHIQLFRIENARRNSLWLK